MRQIRNSTIPHNHAFYYMQDGKRQLFDLGLYLRRRYNNLLGSRYSPNKVYIQSTDVDRALMSAEAALSGLFMPNDEEKWNDKILWQPVPVSGSNVSVSSFINRCLAVADHYQVHTIPKTFDHVLTAGKDCPKYKALFANYMKQSKEVQRIYTEYTDLFSHLSRMSGLNITTITDVYWLYNTLEIELDSNKTWVNL